MGMTDLEADVRLWIYERTAATGTVPDGLEIGEQFSLTSAAVADTLGHLQDDHDALVLLPGSSHIWMAEPFSAVPTNFLVRSGDDTWWGNCIWDGLAILALLERDGTVETRGPSGDTDLIVTVENGSLVPSNYIVHFAVAARDWWRSIGFT